MSYLKWTVYKHTSPTNKVYIGITSQTPDKRWLNGRGYVANDYFTKAINKYGWDNFKHEIVAEGLTQEDAEQMEIRLIAEYDSTNRSKGYNISNGGHLTVSGLHWCRPKEGILRGKNHPHFGKHLTEEQKQHLREMNKGEKHPQFGTHRNATTKQKISKAQKGKIIPTEQLEMLKKTAFEKGHVPWNRKPILCVETGKVYGSCTDAMREKQITCIYKALHDCTKTAGGFHWVYYTPNERII